MHNFMAVCTSIAKTINPVVLSVDMISALSSLTANEKQDPCVSFALAFRSAWSLNNYHKMLKLYNNSPKMTGYVIDMFVARERIQALKTMIKAYVYYSWVSVRLSICEPISRGKVWSCDHLRFVAISWESWLTSR